MQNLLLLSIFLCLYFAQAVDRSKFRTCKDTGFCKRNRFSHANREGGSTKPTYTLSAIAETKVGQFSAKVLQNSEGSAISADSLKLSVSFHATGAIRVVIGAEKERWKPSDLLVSQQLAAYKILDPSKDQEIIPTTVLSMEEKSYFAFTFDDSSSGNNAVLIVYKAPMKFELYKDDVLQITANDRSLLHFEVSDAAEHRKLSAVTNAQGEVDDDDRHGGKTITGYWEDGLAIYEDGTREERRLNVEPTNEDKDAMKGDNFGGHPDSMPLGPKSVGIDFAFPYANDVYGIPEHTSPLSLPTTTTSSSGASSHYNEPYRMYSLDVFEYELDNTMALYGSIPFMLAHALVPSTNKGMTAGVFWFNPSETFVDISEGGTAESPFKESHWISESGEIDFFMFAGPSIKDIYRQFTTLIGTQQLPPLFSLGYHQCRWNYRDEKDVAAVEQSFEDLDYPYDVLWLDIEHTDGKRYFTWDKKVFPNPIEMQQNLTKHGRKLVTIVDPHIKRDNNYWIHKEASQKGLYVLDKKNEDFDGWCWPGQSSYLDFTNPKVRQWWAEQFALDKYVGSTMDCFTWNDMNEPSVFNGPEVSMPKDAKNLEGVEHREWHNLYGMYMQMATQEGLTIRSPKTEAPVRPFVLTRSFWAGSQRWGAMWTGDNTATWGHLQIAAPMLLSINLAGLSFAGSDVGGFFGEPGAELFTRWYQAGAFTPFFRGHAHHDTKRREPWVWGEPYTDINRATAMLRYSLLPMWYTAFFEAYETGMPVMRTMFMEYPDDAATFKMDSQWMVGGSLLVKPITVAGQMSTDVYLPGNEDWFDLYSFARVSPSASGGDSRHVEAPLDKIPVFMRAGVVLPRKMRLRRSSKLMHFDPYTLIITPDSTGAASGALYLDDEFSLAHEVEGLFAVREFQFQGGNSLACKKMERSSVNAGNVRSESQEFDAVNTVERVIIVGQTKGPKAISLTKADGSKEELSFVYDSSAGTITIKKPDCRVVEDWLIELEF